MVSVMVLEARIPNLWSPPPSLLMFCLYPLGYTRGLQPCGLLASRTKIIHFCWPKPPSLWYIVMITIEIYHLVIHKHYCAGCGDKEKKYVEEKKTEPIPGSVERVKHSEGGKTIYSKMPT